MRYVLFSTQMFNTLNASVLALFVSLLLVCLHIFFFSACLSPFLLTLFLYLIIYYFYLFIYLFNIWFTLFLLKF